MLQLRREASRASAAANVELMDFELRRPRVLRRRSPRVPMSYCAVGVPYCVAAPRSVKWGVNRFQRSPIQPSTMLKTSHSASATYFERIHFTHPNQCDSVS